MVALANRQRNGISSEPKTRQTIRSNDEELTEMKEEGGEKELTDERE